MENQKANQHNPKNTTAKKLQKKGNAKKTRKMDLSVCIFFVFCISFLFAFFLFRFCFAFAFFGSCWFAFCLFLFFLFCFFQASRISRLSLSLANRMLVIILTNFWPFQAQPKAIHDSWLHRWPLVPLRRSGDAPQLAVSNSWDVHGFGWVSEHEPERVLRYRPCT